MAKSPSGQLDVSRIEITVVITTTGRAELGRALRSVSTQTLAANEVLVVDDRPPGATDRLFDGTVFDARVLRTGGVGGGGARNAGIREATGDVVALLDDDDIWFPWKLQRQVEHLLRAAEPKRTIVSCQAFVESASSVHPRRPLSRGSASEFLFCRRLPFLRYDSFLQTSGLVFPVGLGKSIPFDSDLRSHQDWDWLIRAERHGAELVIVPEALYVYCAPGPGSVTRSARLDAEQDWAVRTLGGEGRALFGYMLTVAAPRALDFGQWRFARSALRRAFSLGQFDLGSFVVGIGYIGLGLARWARRSITGWKHDALVPESGRRETA